MNQAPAVNQTPPPTRAASPWRWLVLFVFSLAAALNYLDRQLLAAFSKTIIDEFSLNATQYGLIVSAYSIPYALAAPFAGMFLDRTGLNLGSMAQVAAWSVVGMATSLVGGFAGRIEIGGACGFGAGGATTGGACGSSTFASIVGTSPTGAA